jgi:hypothetical protein
MLPCLLQVLGSVPAILEQQAAELDQQDKQQQQQQAAAEGAGSSSSQAAAAQQPGEQEQSAEGDLAAALEAKGVAPGLAAAVDAALKLDDDTLASVSRAIMGRLDVVDLVGRNTAYEVAERVRLFFLCCLVLAWGCHAGCWCWVQDSVLGMQRQESAAAGTLSQRVPCSVTPLSCL